MKKKLILASGEVFYGEAFGGGQDASGEVVFNTSMSGYQELLTDPSNCGQMVCLTYPLIGNYGINRDDNEAIVPVVKAVIVKEVCDFPSNFRSQMSLDAFLKQHNIAGLSGIDTRRLTRVLRNHGTIQGKIVDADNETATVDNEYRKDLTAQVSTKTPYASPGRGLKVVLVDFGSKLGILRELSLRNCDVTVVPNDTSAPEILQMNPDGVVLSNGPGNPEDVESAPKMIRELLGKVPLFGICMGHQLIALACGAKTFKLKFGHRGGNHPVKNLKTGKVAITSQNHSYAVASPSLAGTGLVETHTAINDNTNQGLLHEQYPCMSVQFHPEASPGPEDTGFLFDDFILMMENFKNK